jgi:hypothetical protein
MFAREVLMYERGIKGESLASRGGISEPVRLSSDMNELSESRRQYMLLENQETWYDCLKSRKGGNNETI